MSVLIVLLTFAFATRSNAELSPQAWNLISFFVPLVPAFLLSGSAILKWRSPGALMASFGGSVAVFFFGVMLLQSKGLSTPRLSLYRVYMQDTEDPARILHAEVFGVNAADSGVDYFLTEDHHVLVVSYPPNTSSIEMRLELPNDKRAKCNIAYSRNAQSVVYVGEGDDATCKLIHAGE
ncbi:hypothetical protein [Enhygromyxa salina]|uniref:Uncharacterized protein n=1 Tax=Enhygromyxa salina TaxID=215803 RepID=A0A2S9XL20_9BACT|nr:hypothetical protein [Enhygromyxa salina]PRP93576.1 hypothetical protein ENSA7_80040 [Enhygromyxa salina]